MSILRTARSLLDLGLDAVEALLYSVFDFDRQADQLWSETSSAAALPPEAADDRRGGSVPNQDVEPPRFPNLTVDERDFASFAIRRYAEQSPTTRFPLFSIADKLDPAK